MAIKLTTKMATWIFQSDLAFKDSMQTYWSNVEVIYYDAHGRTYDQNIDPGIEQSPPQLIAHSKFRMF